MADQRSCHKPAQTERPTTYVIISICPIDYSTAFQDFQLFTPLDFFVFKTSSVRPRILIGQNPLCLPTTAIADVAANVVVIVRSSLKVFESSPERFANKIC